MKKNWYLFCFIFCLYLLISIPGNADDINTDNLPEIHLLIDVSANMKNADPQGLRLYAIKKIINLANQKAKMSLSIFATDYKELLPLQLITPKYEQEFIKKTQEIKSDGLANLDGALNSANQFSGKGKKIIIILTDGQLNLGSEQSNTQSRQQLINSTIPKLQQNGVQVYSLVLSARNNKTLLTHLSLKTNGLSQTVLSANDLNSALNSIFAANIPIENTSFNKNMDTTRSIKVDPKTHEFTLIFKKNALVTDLYLTAPDGIKHSVAKENNGILASKNYQMVQKKGALPGEWILSGPAQQMEHVFIVTNASIGTNLTAGIYFNNEFISLTGYLEQENRPITTEMAVENMEMNFKLNNKNKKFSYVIPYDKNGLFDNDLILNVPTGIYNAIWSAQSPYLSKEHQFTMNIHKTPFELYTNSDHDALMVKLVQPNLINVSSVGVKIFYKEVLQKTVAIHEDLFWVMNLGPLCQKPSFSEDDVLVEITAQAVSGRDLMFKLLLNEELCSPNYKPYVISQLIKPHKNPDTKPATKPQENIAKNKINKKSNYTFLIMILVLIVISAGLIYTVLRGTRYKSKKISDEFNDYE